MTPDTDLTPEELARRVHAALSEAGYPEAVVEPATSPWGEADAKVTHEGIPCRVMYRAFQVAGGSTLPCFDCWKSDRTRTMRRCIDGDCSSGVTA